jgi:hypothetical protein
MVRRSVRRRSRVLFAALLGLALGLALAACPLPSNVRYRCEPDDTCAQADYRCAADGYCYPGECEPRDTATACAEVECGLVPDGCGNFTDCAKWCPEGLECGVAAANLCGAPRLCTPSGWCWENPLPQGATLYAAWRADERHAYFVGELGTVLLFDGEKSSLETLPLDAPATFYGVHGTSRSDVYVVGSDGLIFHFDGTAWTKEGLGTGVPATLRSVVALPGGRAVAVGAGGRVVFREPSSPADRRWRDSTSGITDDLMDVVALPDGGVWALSLNGTVLAQRADQMNWSAVPAARAPFFVSPPEGYGAHALAVFRARVFAGGTPGGARSGLMRLEDDGGWEAVSDAGRDVYDVFGTDDELWTAGRAVVERFAADAGADPILGQPPTTPVNGPSALPWRAGVLLRPGESLVGGRLGVMAVARPASGQLLMRSKGSVRDVNAVCGYGPGALYGASTVEIPSQGCGGGTCRPRVLERLEAPAGAYWRINDGMPLGGTTELLGCYAYGPDRVWLMGNDSKYFSQSGSSWVYGDFGNTGITGAYIAGWGTPDAGYLFLRDGDSTVNESVDGQGNWNERSVPGPGQPLNGVWGFGPTDKVLVGEGGVVMRWLSDHWEDPLMTGFTENLLTVHGARLAQGGQRYVAAGVDGRVFMLETGDAASTVSVGTSVRLTGSWVSTSGEAWVAGFLDQATPRAFIARQRAPGGTFEPVPFVADRELRGLFGLDLPDGGTEVWVTGQSGLILRHDGP